MSLPFSQSFKAFSEEKYCQDKIWEHGEKQQRAWRPQLSKTGSQIVSRCHGSWHFPDDNLYPADIPWLTVPWNLSVFHLISCLPPLPPVYMSNKLFHVPKLHLWVGFVQVSVLGKKFSNKFNQSLWVLYSPTLLNSWLIFVCIFYQIMYYCFK